MKKCNPFVIIKVSVTILITAIVSNTTIFSNVPKVAAEELKREEGLSVHVMPKRVAELDKTKQVKWGFMISQSYKLQPPLERPIFTKPEELIKYFRTLPKKVQENGIWVVTTHPDAYSEEENVSMRRLKEMCVKDGIPLFICRGSELPNGWKRVK